MDQGRALAERGRQFPGFGKYAKTIDVAVSLELLDEGLSLFKHVHGFSGPLL
jgi:hypothetical protein